jgi:hypothetical protein
MDSLNRCRWRGKRLCHHGDGVRKVFYTFCAVSQLVIRQLGSPYVKNVPQHNHKMGLKVLLFVPHWCAPQGICIAVGGDGSGPLLGSSPRQYASQFHNLMAAKDRLYVPRQWGQWRQPARWLSSVCRGNEHHIARIVMLCNNQHKRQEVKWHCNSSPGGISSAMVVVAATMQQST